MYSGTNHSYQPRDKNNRKFPATDSYVYSLENNDEISVKNENNHQKVNSVNAINHLKKHVKIHHKPRTLEVRRKII